MFKRKDSKINRNINVVKIGDIDTRNLGLYLDEDFELSYTISKEITQEYVLGRVDPYIVTKEIPIEFSIEFNLKEQSNFYGRIEHIKKILELSVDKLLTFNNENTGHRIIYCEITDISRNVDNNKVSIYFVLSSDFESEE